MTVAAGTARVQYSGTPTPSTGPFAFNFRVYDQTHIKIVRTSALGVDTTLTLTTHYTVTIADEFASAEITLVTALTDGEKLTIYLDPPIEQEADYPRNDAFPSSTHERALDLLTMICARLSEQLGRSLLLPESSSASSLTVPEPDALKVLRWNAGATALENADMAALPSTTPVYTAADYRKVLAVSASTVALAFVPRLYDIDGALTTAGTGAAYTLATTYPYATVADVKWVRAKMNVANTGACTLAVDGLTATAIKKADGADPDADDLKAGGIYDFVYTGTVFQVINIGGGGAVLDIPALTADTAPDVVNDLLLTYDNSAAVNKKVTHSRIGIGRQTLFVPASSMTPRITSGPSANSVETTTYKVQLRTLNFDAAAVEYAQFQVVMPKGWNRSTVTARFRWSHAATTVNFGVVWGIRAVAASDGDTLDVAYGALANVTDTGGTTDVQYVSAETAAVTVAGGPTTGDLITFDVQRTATDGADTMAIDARLHGIEIFYTTEANTDD